MSKEGGTQGTVWFYLSHLGCVLKSQSWFKSGSKNSLGGETDGACWLTTGAGQISGLQLETLSPRGEKTRLLGNVRDLRGDVWGGPGTQSISVSPPFLPWSVSKLYICCCWDVKWRHVGLWHGRDFCGTLIGLHLCRLWLVKLGPAEGVCGGDSALLDIFGQWPLRLTSPLV